MKQNKRRLQIPQNEFGFAPETFNLFAEATLDGERLNREQSEADHARIFADIAQARLFAVKLKHPFERTPADTKTDTKRVEND